MRYFEVASKLITQEPNKDIPGYGFGVRHIQILLQFSLATIFVAMNLTLPITIVAMTSQKYSGDVGSTVFPFWTDQSLILVSVQCGYAVTQLFGGVVSRAYGYQFVMCFSMFLTALFSLLIPIMTRNFSSQGLIVCLLVQGASQGFALPVIPDYLHKWVPTSEKYSIGTLMYAANALGSALGTKVAAYLTTSFLGWSLPYYIFGTLGLVWTYFMIHFGRNAPENCEEISAEEREFIKYGNKQRHKVPWEKILTSPAVLAIWAAHAGTFWALWLMTAEIPTYLCKVQHYSLEKGGDIMSDAYFMSWLFSFIMSGLTDYLIRSKILSLNVTRKISQSIASYLAAGCLVILGFMSDPQWVTFLITTIFVALTTSFWGFMLNYNDITHNRGVVSEIGGFIATITTLFPAIIKQFIVADQSSGTQWALIFWITAAVTILSNTAFFFYSSGDIEEWDVNQNSKVEQGLSRILSKKEESKYLMEKDKLSARRNNYNSEDDSGPSKPPQNKPDEFKSVSEAENKVSGEEESEHP